MKQVLSGMLRSERKKLGARGYQRSERAQNVKVNIEIQKFKHEIKRRKHRAELLLEMAEELQFPRLILYYEDSLRDFKSTFDHVFELLVLSAPEDFDYHGKFFKLSSDNLRDHIENYDKLARDSFFAPYLQR